MHALLIQFLHDLIVFGRALWNAPAEEAQWFLSHMFVDILYCVIGWFIVKWMWHKTKQIGKK